MQGDLESRYKEVVAKLARAARDAGRTPPPTLIAVSKTQGPDAIEALYRLGQRDFGENYVQELIEKAEDLQRRGCGGIRWHFIGHLQTNKVKALLPRVHSVHSVDSVKLAQELAKRWRTLGREGEKLAVFLEVNIDDEESKSGVHPLDAAAIARQLREFPELALEGLMAIPAPSPEGSGGAFRRLRALSEELGELTQGQLSMGMTQDFELAVREGSTHVRVGTAIFGARS